MKHAAAIISGGVAILSIGLLGVLLFPNVLLSLKAYGSEPAISGYLPGGPGFLLTQLVTGFFVSILILTSLLVRSARILRFVALFGSVFAIALFLMDRFWLSIVVVVEILTYWYYEWASTRR